MSVAERSSSFGIRQKLWLLSGLAVMGVAVLLTVSLRAEKTVLMEQREKAVQQTVEVAHSMVAHYHKQAEKGLMSQDDAKRAALEAVRQLRYGGNEYYFITDMGPKVLMHPIKPELEGKDASTIKDPTGKLLFVEFVKTVKASGAGFVHYLWPKPGQEQPVDKVSYVAGFAPLGWVIGSGLYTDNVEQAFRHSAVQSLIGGTGLVLLLLILSRMITGSITRPLAEAVQVANRISTGDLNQRILVAGRDELGQLMRALNEMSASLGRIVGQVRQGSATISTASIQIAAGNADLSSRTDEQKSSLQETASAMEELTSTVRQNADNARQANQLAASASEVAIKGGKVVSQVVETMQDINESSRKIVDIIGVIDGIAFQTNILALNAAVEAARAGEQGRGFAVVASEVRTLAQRSASAAKEIKELIGDSVEKVDAGSQLVGEAGATMEKVVQSVRQVTDIMGEIAAASHEQSLGIEQVNLSINQMDQVTQQNAALVEEAAAAAQSLQDQAGTLAQVVSIFCLSERDEAGWTGLPPARPGWPAQEAPKPRHAKPAAEPGKASAADNPSARLNKIAVADGSKDEWQEF